MQRRSFMLAGLGLSGLYYLPAKIMFSKTDWALPKVLILGDSISIGYTPYVQQMLSGIAEVSRPIQEDGKAENCEGTTKGAAEIDRWLGEEKWDLISFNFGLHDLKHVNPKTGENSMSPKDSQQAPLKKYRKNMEVIVERLLATKANLIFVTTTPYPNPVNGPLRQPGEPQKYNEEAVKIMKKHKIEVNDLYAFVKPQMEAIMLPKNVHFTDAGYQALAEQVAKMIKEVVMRNP